jgi:hypothetical protein
VSPAAGLLHAAPARLYLKSLLMGSSDEHRTRATSVPAATQRVSTVLLGHCLLLRVCPLEILAVRS